MIVGAIEMTAHDERTMPVLRRLAVAVELPVVLLHVLAAADGVRVADDDPMYLRACAVLNRLADQLDADGVTTLPVVAAGGPDTIETFARQVMARYIVIHGYTVDAQSTRPQDLSSSLS